MLAAGQRPFAAFQSCNTHKLLAWPVRRDCHGHIHHRACNKSPVVAAAPPKFEISAVPGMQPPNLGMFAATPLRPGDLILEEEPLLSFPASFPPTEADPAEALQQLPDARRAAYMALGNRFSIEDSPPLTGIWATNAYVQVASVSGSGSTSTADCHGVWQLTSRINHSCLATATTSTLGMRKVLHYTDNLKFLMNSYSEYIEHTHWRMLNEP